MNAATLIPAERTPAGEAPARAPGSSEISGGALILDGRRVLEGISSRVWRVVDPLPAAGVLLHATIDSPACYVELPLGRIAGLRRFTSAARSRPYWVEPVSGTTLAEIRPETQWLLAETAEDVLLFVPLLDEPTRFALQGGDALHVVAETGDPAVASHGGTALFLIAGRDPYELFARAARAVQQQHGTGRLRVDKRLPDFVNRFGWCTWDAFYRDVSLEKVLAGLASLTAGGVPLRYLIVDDGWQSVRRRPSGEDRLVGFDPNEKFGGDLAPLIAVAKETFRIEQIFVWHALLGYWGGVCEQALPAYGTRTVARSFGPGLLWDDPHCNVRPWGAVIGVPAAERAGDFFRDYHRRLQRMGVAGVKVDCQAALEAVSAGQGGRVTLGKAFRRALETSAEEHFDSRLLNCMSCTPECVYLAERTVVMRTSDDFWPDRPEAHGSHVFTNAHAALWYGEFMLPDWDMFQSAHAFAGFHAAARAVSGGPIYVSDRPAEHDFTLLRKLVLSDGSILRADEPGRLTRDCLFARSDALQGFKVFNRNGTNGLVGLFNGAPPSASAPKSATLTTSPSDVPGLPNGTFAALAHRSGQIWITVADQQRSFQLAPAEWELVSYVPIHYGFAAFGLADKLNSVAAIRSVQWSHARECTVELRDGGCFMAWAETRPTSVRSGPTAIAFTYEDGVLRCELPPGAPCGLLIQWPAQNGE